MSQNTIFNFVNASKSAARFGPARDSGRRLVHGGSSLNADDSELYQPQDGASPIRPRRSTELTPRGRRQLTGEPEDARLTGGTRSLMRRLMGLNLGKRNPLPTPRANVA